MSHPRRNAVSVQLEDWLSNAFDQSVLWISAGYASVIERLDPNDSRAVRAWLSVERSLKTLAQKLTR